MLDSGIIYIWDRHASKGHREMWVMKIVFGKYFNPNQSISTETDLSMQNYIENINILIESL